MHFYNPQIALKLKNLISYLPLWTDIMHYHFKCNKIVVGKLCIYEAMIFPAGVRGRGENWKRGVLWYGGGQPMSGTTFSSHHLSRFSSPTPVPGGACVCERHDVTMWRDVTTILLESRRVTEGVHAFFPTCTVTCAVSLALALARTDAVGPTPFARTFARSRSHARSLALARMHVHSHWWIRIRK